MRSQITIRIHAIDLEIATTNYTMLVELPLKEESRLHKPFSGAELAELWKNTGDLGAKVALILCYTGLRPSEFAKIKNADVNLSARYMRGGIKTAAGKNRLIPVAEKIFPLIGDFYKPANEYLLTLDGAAISAQPRETSRLFKLCFHVNFNKKLKNHLSKLKGDFSLQKKF